MNSHFRHTLRRATALPLILACGYAMTACSSGTEDSNRNATYGKQPSYASDRSGLTASLTLPLEGYLVPFADQAAVERSQLVLERACMAKMGFTYNPPPPVSDPGPGKNAANLGRRYGISDLKSARSYGYHLAAPLKESPHYNVSPEELYALMGENSSMSSPPADVNKAEIPKGGCVGEARAKIPSLDESLASQFDADSLKKSQDDVRVINSLKAWSACMAKRGYHVDNPHSVPELASSMSSATISSGEIATAVADVECKDSTGLIKDWFAVEKEIQNQQIEANRPALDQARKKNQDVMRKASSF
ncbi:hypothetical protein [Streptomyces sp. NBC_00083]|uniref:hypothetical protein n=1 Tax=Streptomyces sp. NBC_00083 TaxID=2975647 RepID=UPI0022563AA1|nr:hypothetical protein [Streptomyces sp. NBC_00083]MCX5388370.1 hypothetical protein [Streptomyces sp. NBC_00083]